MSTSRIVLRLILASALLLLLSATSGVAEEKSATSALSGLAQQATSLAEGGVNINDATPEMLASIPGIGPQLSEAITTYRDANGKFTEFKDLLNVDGIDMALIEKIKPLIKF